MRAGVCGRDDGGSAPADGAAVGGRAALVCGCDDGAAPAALDGGGGRLAVAFLAPRPSSERDGPAPARSARSDGAGAQSARWPPEPTRTESRDKLISSISRSRMPVTVTPKASMIAASLVPTSRYVQCLGVQSLRSRLA
eukprot:Amastigsp_a345603_17.p5 type:complete len:139 gc:universal Amastigsp_a345603_17:84-500(+)